MKKQAYLKCKHKNFRGREIWSGQELISFNGYCLDCCWNMTMDVSTREWNKLTRFTKKEADELKMYEQLRGIK